MNAVPLAVVNCSCFSSSLPYFYHAFVSFFRGRDALHAYSSDCDVLTLSLLFAPSDVIKHCSPPDWISSKLIAETVFHASWTNHPTHCFLQVLKLGFLAMAEALGFILSEWSLTISLTLTIDEVVNSIHHSSTRECWSFETANLVSLEECSSFLQWNSLFGAEVNLVADCYLFDVLPVANRVLWIPWAIPACDFHR